MKQLGRSQERALTSGSLVSSGSITILLWEAQSSALGRPCVELAMVLLLCPSHLPGQRGVCGMAAGLVPPHLPVCCLLPPHIFPENSHGLLGEENTHNPRASPADLRSVC